MTSREHYEKLIETIENSKIAETFGEALEQDEPNEALTRVYNALIETTKANQDAYYESFGISKDDMIDEYNKAYNNLADRKALAIYFYDAYVIEKIREYAYELHLNNKINNYVQLASDMQDCYLDSLKEDGLYDEWRGSEYCDIDASIGDGPKLEGY